MTYLTKETKEAICDAVMETEIAKEKMKTYSYHTPKDTLLEVTDEPGDNPLLQKLEGLDDDAWLSVRDHLESVMYHANEFNTWLAQGPEEA